MTDRHDDEFEQMRLAALRNAGSVLAARQRAEEELLAAKEELRRANERMENMLESLADGFCTVDRDWRITYINARALMMLAPLGKTRGGLIGADLWDEFPELAGSELAQDYRRAMELRVPTSREVFYPSIRCWLEVRVYPSPDGLTLYFHDISRRKADQQAVIESNTRLQLALAAGRLGDWRWDAATDRVTLGERAAEILELPAETPLSWHALRQRVAETDRDGLRRALRQAFETHGDLNFECRLLPGAARARWVSLVGRVDYADRKHGGALVGMTGVVQDISARKSTEDNLRQSEEMLRALANTIPQLAWMAGPDGAIVWFNERWYEYTGTTPEQTTGWGWEQVHDPTVLPSVLEHWHDSIRTGAPFEMEFPIRGADGQYRWFLTRVNAVRDSTGRVLRWFGTNTDVDQVKRAEQALREESNVLELLNSTGSALASTRDLRSLLQTATDAATGVSGARFGAFFYSGQRGDCTLFSLHTLSGATSSAFQTFGEPRAIALFGPSFGGREVIRSDDITLDPPSPPGAPHFGLPLGAPAVRSYLAVPVIGQSGEILGSMFFGHPERAVFTERAERIVRGIAAQAAVAIDNTRLYEAAQRAAEERKLLLENEREARAEAERTSQMKDEFLATLSHELRTPLNAMLGWSQLLLQGNGDEAMWRRGLETIERNARAQSRLIEDMLDMSRLIAGQMRLDVKPVWPAEFIEAAIETARPAALARQVGLHVRLDGGAGPILGDAGRMQQVMANLLSNAVKFTEAGGRVEVSLAREGGQARIAVRDSGVGISEAFLPHVFDRFRQADASSTRRHGGLGLGLAIARQLVELQGGTISAASAGHGKGAEFSLRFPLQTMPALERVDPRPVAEPAPASVDLSGLSVLIVEDQPDSLELVQQVVASTGATVLTASGAEQALLLMERHQPRLLISDIGLPGMDGFTLIERVRGLERGQAAGPLVAIALTAFSRREDQARALDAGFDAFLAKPFMPSVLLRTLTRLLDAPSRHPAAHPAVI